MPRVVYRIVVTDPPGDEDYLSFAQLGRFSSDTDTEKERMAKGLSVLINLKAARKKAMGRPWHRDGYIAEYQLPDDPNVVLEQTGRIPTHYTLWCNVNVLRAALIRIVPIMEDHADV